MAEVEINGQKYPAATQGARMARCYVCNEVVGKHHMISIGPSPSPLEMPQEERLYIWRCEDCYAGSPKWLKHRMHLSKIGGYYKNLELPKDAEAQKALGRLVVEERRREIEDEIVRRLDAKKEGRNDDSGGSMVASGKKVGAKSRVVIQKTRSRGHIPTWTGVGKNGRSGREGRRAKVSRTRQGW